MGQWLAAYERRYEPPKPEKSAAPVKIPAPAKAKRLNYKEQQEWDGMEAAIMKAEEALAARHADVEQAAGVVTSH